MPRIDIAAVPVRKGSGYPAPFDAPCADRTRQRLGDAGGLTDFGVNLMRLPLGADEPAIIPFANSGIEGGVARGPRR